MTKALILLTALPPTVGHGHLIKWAANFLKWSGASTPQLYVMVCTQPGEPMSQERFESVHAFALGVTAVPVKVEFLHATMPQYPRGEDDADFWTVWTRQIERQCGPIDVVFSSESYGRRLAAALGARHFVADPERLTHSVSATAIRNDPVGRFSDILPEFRRHVVKTVTVFGAESIGKSTLARAMKGDHVTEWARPYLESLTSPETTDERMGEIVTGQLASQVTALQNVRNPIIVQDTDLLSTVGYYRIYGQGSDYGRCIEAFRRTRSDLYIVLKSDIPFSPDPLRYGGDHRESTDQFWFDLLEEFDCKYQVIYTVDLGQRVQVADTLAKQLFLDQPIWSFIRDKEKVAA
jgi:HTH-type transcriptional repressor of NAD biosynthesis genes